VSVGELVGVRVAVGVGVFVAPQAMEPHDADKAMTADR